MAIDFPSQVTDTAPTFLVGGNDLTSQPAKAALTAAARALLAKVDPYDLAGSTLARFAGVINPQTGTTYALTLTDQGSVITVDNALDCSISLPANIPVGFSVMFCQLGAGQVVCVPESGATVVNREGFLRTALPYSVISLLVIANAGGTAATYLLMGDAA